MSIEVSLPPVPTGSGSVFTRWWSSTIRHPHRFIIWAFVIAVVLLLLIVLRGLQLYQGREIESLRQMQDIRLENIDAKLQMEAERLRSVRNFAEHLLRLQRHVEYRPDDAVRSAFASRNDDTWWLTTPGAPTVRGVSPRRLEGLDGFRRRDEDLMPGLDIARSIGHLLRSVPESAGIQRRLTYVSNNGFVVAHPAVTDDNLLKLLRRYAGESYFHDNLPPGNGEHQLQWHVADATDRRGDTALFLSIPVYAGDAFRGVAISEISRHSLDDSLSHAPHNGVESFLIDRSGTLVAASQRNVRSGETLRAVLHGNLPASTLSAFFGSPGMLDNEDGNLLMFHRLGDSGLAMVDVVSTQALLRKSAMMLNGVAGAGALSLGLLLCITLMVVNTLFKHYLARGEALRVLAEADALTGLANRRVFQSRFAVEYAHCARESLPISLIMLDIDHFKRINDHWGHASGDIVLRQLAVVLRGNVRTVDVAARLGGEEFAILLPRTNVVEAARVAEQLRQAVARIVCEPTVDAIGKGNIRFTASFGVAEIVPDGTNNLETLMLLADQRLYAAKAAGRDRVVSQS